MSSRRDTDEQQQHFDPATKCSGDIDRQRIYDHHIARKPINRWVVLGIVLGVVVFLLGSWLAAWINNWFVSAAWSLLVLAVILEPLYQRWSRRRRSRSIA